MGRVYQICTELSNIPSVEGVPPSNRGQWFDRLTTLNAVEGDAHDTKMREAAQFFCRCACRRSDNSYSLSPLSVEI